MGHLTMLWISRQDKLKDYEKQLAQEKKKRLLERKETRKAERRAKWYQEKEEAEQRARDELLKKGWCRFFVLKSSILSLL